MKAECGDYITFDNGISGDRIINAVLNGAEEIYECESGSTYSESELGVDNILLESEADDPDPGDMDGDFDSAMASAGFGTDEDYGCYGGDE